VKRLSTGLLAALVAVGIGTTSVSAQNPAHAQGNIGPSAHPQVAQAAPNAMPPADFGTPPSGEVPILFNDRHVYSKPDRLKANRVLAALVRGNTILIPLRSMFEQMGATVSYDGSSKTVHVSKSGADLTVTVGSPQVTINGETRPLDVPPEIDNGVVMVPIRVISEAMGAYVQWVPDRQIVVVRYIVATPPPPPATAPPATPPPTPVPTPTPRPKPKEEAWIVGNYSFAGKSYDEFSPGNRTTGSWNARAGGEFNVGIPMMIALNYYQYRYNHNNDGLPCPGGSGCVTVVGRNGQTQVPAFTVRQVYGDGRLGFKVVDPRIYVDVGYIYNNGNVGYPTLNGVEFGAEKIPDYDQTISWYAGYFYAPNIRSTYTGFGQSLPMQYSYQSYDLGITFDIAPKSIPVIVDVGYSGNRGNFKANSPSSYTHNGAYAGLGYSFSY
jgi:hypothetical protein